MTGRHTAAPQAAPLPAPGHGRLGLRSVTSELGALIALAALVAVVTAAGVAAPRLTDALLSADLRGTIASASPAYRDLISTIPAPDDAGFGDPTGAGAATWRAMPKVVARARDAVPAGFRAALDDGHYSGTAAGVTAGRLPPVGFTASGLEGGLGYPTDYRMHASPELRRDTRLVSGTWPRPATAIGGDRVLEVAATERTATAMHWRLGRTQTFTQSTGAFTVRLVGIVVPRDPSSDFWSIDAGRARTSLTFNDGQPNRHGSVFVDASSWAALSPLVGGESTDVWFGIRPAAFSVASLPGIRTGLSEVLANPIDVAAVPDDARSVRFSTFLPQALDLFANRANSSSAILLLSSAGPLGVAAITLVLAVGALLARRGAVRELLRSRGASVLQLAGAAARDVAAASIPGAVVGTAVVLVTTPQGASWAWIAAAAIGLAGPPLLAAAAVAGGALGGDHPSAAARIRRLRWVGEVLLGAGAFAALAIAVPRALAGSDPSAGDAVQLATDPLVIATPLLAAAAVIVLLLRARPRLARVLLILARRRGPAAFVGTAEDVRGGSGAAWVLATIVGSTSIGIVAGLVARSAASADVPVSGSTKGLDTDPLVSGIDGVVTGGLLLAAAMTAAAIALTVVSAAPIRQRRGAMLRTLGLDGRQRTAVTLWELVPRILLGGVAGTVLGVLVAAVVVPIVVPAPATQAAVLDLDPAAIGLPAALFAGAAALATLVAVVTDRRRSGVLDDRSQA